MKRLLIFLLLLVQLAGFAASAAAAPTIPPKPTGQNIYVQDYANIIASSDENKITAAGQSLQNQTTAQLSVITVKSLDGVPIDEYALAVLRAWGVGQKNNNNGALIVIAPNERRSRIEIGYGLEGVLTDRLTGNIQDKYMLPYFRKNDYSEGITQGYLATAGVIAKSYGATISGADPVPAKQAKKAQKKQWTLNDILMMGGILILIILDNMFLGGFFTRILLLALLRGGGRGGRRGGGGGFGGGSGGGGGSSRSW